jgi:hypothetical protein
MHHNDRFGVNGNAPQGAVLRNEVASNAWAWDPGYAGGVKLVNTTGVSVIENAVHDNGSNGIWLDERVVAGTVRGNRTWANAEDGIRIEISTGTLVEANVAQDGIDVVNSQLTTVSGNTVSAPSTKQQPLRFLGNGRIEDRVEMQNADNVATANVVTLVAGQSVGVIRSAGTTVRNRFVDNVYHVPTTTGRYFKWWTGTAKETVAFADWQGRFGQDRGGRIVVG